MDSTDPTEMHEPTDPTELVAPPTDGGSRNLRPLLLAVIVVLSLGVVGVAVAAVGGFDADSGEEGAQLVTVTSTAVSAQEVAAPSSVTTTDSAVALTTTQAQAAVPPAQPEQTGQQPTGQVTPQGEPTGPPTIPPGHVDSCAYPNMGTTVVSGTTYTAAPTPTVTAVTSPQQCPPYSAGYPWDGS